MSFLITELGTRIKLIRVYSGVKQKILANELGIPAPLLSMYEQGNVNLYYCSCI